MSSVGKGDDKLIYCRFLVPNLRPYTFYFRNPSYFGFERTRHTVLMLPSIRGSPPVLFPERKTEADRLFQPAKRHRYPARLGIGDR